MYRPKKKIALPLLKSVWLSCCLVACQLNSPQNLAEHIASLRAETSLDFYVHRSVATEDSKDLGYYDGIFLKGDFSQALAGYKTLLEQEPDDVALLIRLGICYWKQGENGEAKAYFERIYKPQKANFFVLDAAWHLGVIALEEGQKEKAKVYLEEVANSRNRQAKAARELLDKLVES